MKVLRIFAGVTLAVGLAALVVGVLALGKSTASPRDVAQVRSQISSLRTQLVRQRATITQQASTIANLQSSSTAGEVAKLSGAVGRLSGNMGKLLTCVPQLQTELGDLNIQQSTQGGYLTDASLQNSAIISNDCTKILYGTG
jgi:hypothetical protein